MTGEPDVPPDRATRADENDTPGHPDSVLRLNDREWTPASVVSQLFGGWRGLVTWQRPPYGRQVMFG